MQQFTTIVEGDGAANMCGHIRPKKIAVSQLPTIVRTHQVVRGAASRAGQRLVIGDLRTADRDHALGHARRRRASIAARQRPRQVVWAAYGAR